VSAPPKTKLDLLGKRLLIVSGKGGVGKTVISSALGLIASAHGKNVLLVKMDDQGRTAQLFGAPAVTDRVSPLRENISAINLDPTTIVADYFQRQLKIRRLVKHIVGSKLFESWFRVSPAIKEMICLGKLLDLVEESSWWHKKPTWDLVIFDAPATGHGLGLLRLPEQASKLLIGGMRRNALEVHALLKNHKSTSLVLVTLPEEMPVSETVHFYKGARSIDMPLGCVILNATAPTRFQDGDLDALEAVLSGPSGLAAVNALLGTNGPPPGDNGVHAAIREAARTNQIRGELTARYSAELTKTVALPRLDVAHIYTESFGYAELERVAADLERSLASAT
jgi:anion-transporting  ArsA/GET3 family ATPase